MAESAAAALRQGPRCSLVVSRYDKRRRDRHGRRRAGRRPAGELHVPERLSRRRCSRSTRAAARAGRRDEQAGRGLQRARRAISPACASRRRSRPAAGCFEALAPALAGTLGRRTTHVPVSQRAIHGLGRATSRHPQYQDLKARIHQELLNRLNLERLTRVKREDAEPEIRGLDHRRCSRPRRRRRPLSLFEREALIGDVLNELFGLGPLEALLRRPDDLRHPGQPLRPGLHRARRQARGDRASSSRTTGT